MPPRVVFDAVKEFMPNFNDWVKRANLPESEVMDSLEEIVGMWLLRTPDNSSFNSKTSNNSHTIYTSTLVTLIEDRGGPQDEMMNKPRLAGSRLLGAVDKKKSGQNRVTGVINWEQREHYVPKNAMRRVDAEEFLIKVGSADPPKKALVGMAYFDAEAGEMLIYDGLYWIKSSIK